MVHHRAAAVSGNGVRYTTEYCIALIRSGSEAKYSEELKQAVDAIKLCSDDIGLLKRHPQLWSGSQQGPDDYVAAIALSAILEQAYPFAHQWMYRYHAKPATAWDDQNENPKKKTLSKILFKLFSLFREGVKGSFNNIRPQYFTLSSWLGRQPQIYQHARFATGDWDAMEDVCTTFLLLLLLSIPIQIFAPINPWAIYATIGVSAFLFMRQLPFIAWIVSCLSSALKSEKAQDEWILGWYLVLAADKKSFLAQPAIDFWRSQIHKKLPGGIGQVIRNNMGEHPNAVWLQGEYGYLK